MGQDWGRVAGDLARCGADVELAGQVEVLAGLGHLPMKTEYVTRETWVSE